MATSTIPKFYTRESQFELLRIIAQWFIILYHLFHMFTVRYQIESPIFLGIQIPLHIGVILFVLISGYFGIKLSVKGVVRIVVQTFVYFVPIALFTDVYLGSGGGKTVLLDSLFITFTPYWFVRTYLYLLLLSPLVNKFIIESSLKQRGFILLVLLYMSVWIGTVRSDPSLAGGKNIVNFILIYYIGNTLKMYQYFWKRIKISKLIACYLLFNITLVSLWYIFRGNIVGDIIMKLSFPYCSPFIILNAILLFMIFGKLSFKSRVVNYCASSVFAVYLIHCQPYVLNNIIAPISEKILFLTSAQEFATIFAFSIFSTLIVLVSIGIDKILYPLWSITDRIANRIDIKLSKISSL